MANYTETQIFIVVRKYLLQNDWLIIGGQPPSGTDYLPVIEIRDPNFKGKGSKGSFKPDLIAWNDSKLFIIELKPLFNNSDREKLNSVLNSSERVNSLWDSLTERNIDIGSLGKMSDLRSFSRVVGGLGYSGTKVEHPELWRFFVNNGEVEVTPGKLATDFDK